MSKRIYIIEDEEGVRFSLVYLIDNLLDGYEVTGFNENGQQGLKECLESKPDLAIVDLMLLIGPRFSYQLLCERVTGY